MAAPRAAPTERRRLSRGLFGALVAFLFLPFTPLLLFGPLAGLLLLSRPATTREWLWLGLAMLFGGLAAGTAGALVQQVSLAYSAVFTGGFAALLALRGPPVLRRAALAALGSAALIAAGIARLGISWSEVTGAIQDQLQGSFNQVVNIAAFPADQLAAIRESLDLMARLYPGLAVLGAMTGGTLAAALAGRIASRPVVPAPGPWRDFRFNDHLIWGMLATLAVLLLPLPALAAELAANALVVWAGLYLARGAAIAGVVAAPWPLVPRVALFLSAVLLLPYALGALLLTGIADTWVDLRRVLRPPPSGGSQ